MISGQINVDPQGILSAGTQISSAAGRLQGHVADFQQELASYGQPWGSDMVGSLIGMCYGVISGVAMQSFTTNISGLDDHGQRVQALSSLYEQAGSADIDDVNRIRQVLG